MRGIYAIILAAGESKRMGFPKMLLPFRGSTIIENAIENVINSQVNGTVVVLGSDHDEIRKVVVNWPVEHCYNKIYSEGMLSSVQCGFRFLPQDFDAVLVFPGDQPGIKPMVSDMVISAFRSSGKGIIIPVFRTSRGHPILISSKYRDQVMTLDPKLGLRMLAEKFNSDVLEIDTGTPEILKDIDTREEYLDELNQ